ncbi:MAG: cysteine peptidase family C39 domain-containing protein [bacterium]|nr:cysteine peptidase family C39 domain-containing protein [bacterium]
MKLQEEKYSCLPAALRAALYSLGHKVSEFTIRKIAGTTEEGTDEQGAIKAIKYYGHTAKEFESTSYKEAWAWLRSCLENGRPVLMCSDKWNHWVTGTAIFGAKTWIFDPDSTTPSRKNRYSGLELYSKRKWMRRWRYCPKDSNKCIYYAICITT